MGIDPQDDEVRELTGLLDACHRVLRHVGDRQDRLAEALRVTCNEVEARLKELGMPYLETEGFEADVGETQYR